MLIMKYNRTDFFNNQVYTEDVKRNYHRKDLRKAFLFMGQTFSASIQIESTVIFWGCLSDFENEVVTVRHYDGTNYKEEKMCFDRLMKELSLIH